MAKLNVKWRLGRSPLGAAVVAILAVFLLVGHRVEAVALVRDSDNPNAAIFPVQSHPLGFSLETWSENWWRWVMSVPAPENPFLSVSSDCSAGQGGPVFFLPPFPPGSKNLTRSCTVDHGQAVAVALSSVLNDFPCPDPTFQPAPGQSLFDFLLAGAVAGNGDIAEIDVTLDGQLLDDILAYHFASHDLFYFKGDLSLQTTVDSCITGGFQPAVVDAYLILVKPLSRGHHTLTRRIVTTGGTVSGPNTTEIDVL
ncbi:MAG TPA: hypothetical protein VGK85_10615 [Myxococcaceae bacterium]